MKIKCPSCDWEDDNVISWGFHVEKHPYKALSNYFHLQQKIHEKIEEFKNAMKDTTIPHNIKIVLSLDIDMLQSFLENEK